MRFKGILVNDGFSKLDVFNERNDEIRDDCLYFLRLLKTYFSKYEIELIQENNVKEDESINFAIDFEVPKIDSCQKFNRYLVRFECELIYPKSYLKNRLEKYKKVFSWNNSFLEPNQFLEISIPNTFIPVSDHIGFQSAKLCCIISSNKSLRYKSPLDLYSQRLKTIRWFEQYAPQDFDLYGQGWDKPAALSGLVGKVINRLQRYISNLSGRVFFPSYRGKVVSKLVTLQKYRFSICYENVRDLPGYITEKIFDSFFAGCIPIYWGAPNITTYIPQDCFIDRRKFNSHEELYYFMVSMTEPEFIAYQERIAAFLRSDQAKPFSAETFAETIVSTIVRDLEVKI